MSPINHYDKNLRSFVEDRQNEINMQTEGEGRKTML